MKLLNGTQLINERHWKPEAIQCYLKMHIRINGIIYYKYIDILNAERKVNFKGIKNGNS